MLDLLLEVSRECFKYEVILMLAVQALSYGFQGIDIDTVYSKNDSEL